MHHIYLILILSINSTNLEDQEIQMIQDHLEQVIYALELTFLFGTILSYHVVHCHPCLLLRHHVQLNCMENNQLY